jgi:hypothetical protein
MDIKKIFIVLVDISGYTRFIRLHKVSLMHAERIIGQLLESVIQASKFPLVAHELEGDAVSFYAVSDGTSEMASDISRQILQFFNAFKAKEAELISDCGLCVCEACATVDKLKLKAVIHHGEAVFTRVGQFQKVAGTDVIQAHRLLKNSIEADEYILVTSDFNELTNGFETLTPHPRQEICEGIGPVDVFVYYPEYSPMDNLQIKRSVFQKLSTLMKLDLHLAKRMLKRSSKSYRNLPKDA